MLQIKMFGFIFGRDAASKMFLGKRGEGGGGGGEFSESEE